LLDHDQKATITDHLDNYLLPELAQWLLLQSSSTAAMRNINKPHNIIILAAIFFLTITAVFETNRRAQLRHGSIWEHGFPTTQSVSMLNNAIDSGSSQRWSRIHPGSRWPIEQALNRHVPDRKSRNCDGEGKPVIRNDEYMRDILKWDRPMMEKEGQWPLYKDFAGKDYDSYRWEGFPQ
jgi:hypothetical protein